MKDMKTIENEGKMFEYLKNMPIIDLGTVPVLGDIKFDVVRARKDGKDRMVIYWKQTMSNSVNYLEGRTILEVNDAGELLVTNTAAEQDLNDIAGMVVHKLAEQFEFTTDYNRRDPSTFKCEHIV